MMTFIFSVVVIAMYFFLRNKDTDTDTGLQPALIETINGVDVEIRKEIDSVTVMKRPGVPMSYIEPLKKLSFRDIALEFSPVEKEEISNEKYYRLATANANWRVIRDNTTSGIPNISLGNKTIAATDDGPRDWTDSAPGLVFFTYDDCGKTIKFTLTGNSDKNKVGITNNTGQNWFVSREFDSTDVITADEIKEIWEEYSSKRDSC